MSAYYNEHDPAAAAWLRELIRQGHIAPGDVDDRSIEDVCPADLQGYRQCHFFAGIGVWSYALRQAGWGDDRPVWTGSCPCQPFSAAGKGAGFADERNVHAQLKQCNRYRFDVAGYRKGLIARIGLEAVLALEADQTPRHYTMEDLRGIRDTYRAKARALRKAQGGQG